MASLLRRSGSKSSLTSSNDSSKYRGQAQILHYSGFVANTAPNINQTLSRQQQSLEQRVQAQEQLTAELAEQIKAVKLQVKEQTTYINDKFEKINVQNKPDADLKKVWGQIQSQLDENKSRFTEINQVAKKIQNLKQSIQTKIEEFQKEANDTIVTGLQKLNSFVIQHSQKPITNGYSEYNNPRLTTTKGSFSQPALYQSFQSSPQTTNSFSNFADQFKVHTFQKQSSHQVLKETFGKKKDTTKGSTLNLDLDDNENTMGSTQITMRTKRSRSASNTNSVVASSNSQSKTSYRIIKASVGAQKNAKVKMRK